MFRHFVIIVLLNQQTKEHTIMNVNKNFIVVSFCNGFILHCVAYRDIESARNHQNNVKPDANLKKFHCGIYEYPYPITHNHEVIKMQANDIRGLKLLSQQTYN